MNQHLNFSLIDVLAQSTLTADFSISAFQRFSFSPSLHHSKEFFMPKEPFPA
jgi:hypothetical protein